MKCTGKRVLLKFCILESHSHIYAEIEELFRYGNHLSLRFSFRCHIEEVEVPAPIIYIEELLIQAFAMNVWGFTCSATYHLPKLNLRLYPLEEYQIKDIRDVDTGIHHIYRNNNLRHFATNFETIDKILSL